MHKFSTASPKSLGLTALRDPQTGALARGGYPLAGRALRPALSALRDKNLCIIRASALDQPRRHFTKVASLPLLGLEYFHEYLDRYLIKEQMRRYPRDTFGETGVAKI